MAGTDSRKDDPGSGYARFFGIGFTLMLAVGIPAVIGFFLDRWLGTLPLFLLVGLGLGFAGALMYVYQAVKKLGSG